MTLHQALAKELQRLIILNDWSQRIVARQLRVEQSTVSHLLHGKRRFSLEMCVRLAALRGTTLSALFADVEARQQRHHRPSLLDAPLAPYHPDLWDTPESPDQ